MAIATDQVVVERLDALLGLNPTEVTRAGRLPFKGKSDELEDWGWEQQPATIEENDLYRVSGLVQRVDVHRQPSG
jgi:hypothetical protein